MSCLALDDMEADRRRGEKYGVQWQPDRARASKQCPLCNVVLSSYLRRHHYRSCGGLVCRAAQGPRISTYPPLVSRNESAFAQNAAKLLALLLLLASSKGHGGSRTVGPTTPPPAKNNNNNSNSSNNKWRPADLKVIKAADKGLKNQQSQHGHRSANL